MTIVFMGTSEFAVPVLQTVHQHGRVAAVISQPDRPRGRGRKLETTPVKRAAQELGLPVYQFDRIKDVTAVNTIASIRPHIILVVAYGQLIPPTILSLPPQGCINLHASLLPYYRGAAPIQRAIMAGETVTGITTMYMDKGLDTGDIILQKSVHLPEDMNHGTLERLLAREGAELMVQTLQAIANGTAPRTTQEHQKATYAGMIGREDEVVDWTKSAVQIHNQIRALSPRPGSFTTLRGKKMKLYASRVCDRTVLGSPGSVAAMTKEGFIVQTGQGTLEVLEVQREGKNRIPAQEFLKGANLESGDRLGG